MLAGAELKAQVLEVHARLCGAYGCPVAFFHMLDPLSELISSLLSHRTKNKDSGRAFKTLRAEFPTWEAVRDGDVAIIQQAISASTWPEQKAPRIKQILQAITAERGNLALDFLADLPVPEARKWLEKLPGVGPKTSAATLIFSTIRGKALPVDSHHYRVAQRLAWLAPTVGEAKSHQVLEALLPPEWDTQHVYDHHEIMMFHGQRCCFWRNPNCSECVLLDLCPTGQARLAGGQMPVTV